MPSETGRFRRSDRILRSREFQHVLGQGKRVASHSFVVFFDAGADGREHRATRLGITVSRKVGNAVVRNRVKRRIREWFRGTRAALPAGSEWVVIARPAARQLEWSALSHELGELATRGVGR